MEIKKTIKFGENNLTIETGVIARQATGSVLVDLDGTTVLVTVVGVQNEKDEARDFFPLRVDYIEKAYSHGKIPGGFYKREGRPAERETLIARLIDRPIRPLFPKKFRSEVQIVATTLSMNPEIEPDIVALIGASAALAISGIPFQEALAAARVGYIDGQFVLNPSCKLMEKSLLDLVVAGTDDSVLMVESEAKLLSEETMLEAVMFGHNAFRSVISLINEIAAEVGKSKWLWVAPKSCDKLTANINNEFKEKIINAYKITDKLERKSEIADIKKEIVLKFLPTSSLEETSTSTNSNESESESTDEEITESRIIKIVEEIESSIVRSNVLNSGQRIDGRDLKTVRPITIKKDILKHAHGSALFTRGETQAIAAVTLGTARDAQIIETPGGEVKENFMLHYNFPPYSVNEIGMMMSPKRREIGHGKLAKRGVSAVIPTYESFPYVVRVVSEITESNGSSSMASVCGASLALMAAGVPISDAVAGIAMGLVKEGDKFAVISDILGDEDHLGDMDFKVAGTKEGVTALQMDIKIPGITKEIMEQALQQARDGRLHILDVMSKEINEPREKVAANAPHIISFKIDTDKIKDVIGKGGATIKSLIEETGSTIDIDDHGNINIAGTSEEAAQNTLKKIEAITADVEVGGIYEGTVMKIVDFGAFVNILPGKDGLLHISQIANRRLEKVTDELSEGQKVRVKVVEVDRQGKIKLSKKILDQ